MPEGPIPRLLLTANSAATPQFSAPLLIALIVLIILSGLFSSTETAFTSANKIRLKNLANNGNKRAASVLKLIDRYDKFISTVLVGNNCQYPGDLPFGVVFRKIDSGRRYQRRRFDGGP